MEIEKEKIQEMQLIEQNLQNIILQKQGFQIELTETENAINEINKSGEEVYKIIGQLMIKSEKNSVLGELKSKQRMIELRIKAMEKQEKSFSDKLEILRNEVIKKLNKDK